MDIWIVTAKGVYDHGVWYATADQEDAERFAREWKPDHDGWHEWRIDKIELGQEPARPPEEWAYWDGRYGHGVLPHRVTPQ